MNMTGTTTTNPLATSGSPDSISSASGSQTQAGDVNGLFQMLFGDVMEGKLNEKKGLDELLSLLSDMNPEQLAELMALLGIQPGNLSGDLANLLSNQNPKGDPAQLQTGVLTPSAVLQSMFFGSNGSSDLKQQLGKEILELLQKANVSLDELLANVKASVEKKGISAGNAFLQQLESIIQTVSSDKGQAITSDGLSRKTDPALFNQQSVIRPELQGIANDLSQQKSASNQAGNQAGASPENSSGQSSVTSITNGHANQNTTVPMASLPNTQQMPQTADSGKTIHLNLRPDQVKAELPVSLIKQAVLLERGGTTEMRVTLIPEGLGEIQVRIVGESGRVALQLAADTAYARALLDTGIGNLKSQLELQGIQVNRVEVVPSSSSTVSTMSTGTGQGMFEGRQQQFSQSNPQRQQSSNSPFVMGEDDKYQMNIADEEGKFHAIA